KGGEPKLPDEPRYFVDKSWHDFHKVFQQKKPPLNQAMTGDSFHPLSPHSLDDFCAGSHDYYIAFASPKLVRQVAEALEAVTVSNYRRWLRTLFEDGCHYGAERFVDLKAAYQQAASRKNALMIVIT